MPDGSPDLAFRGRNGHRNALFAELLVTTGMRLSEAGTLLPIELPAPGSAKSAPVELAPVVCKGGRGRTVRVPARVLCTISGYVDLERQNALVGHRPETDGEPQPEPASRPECQALRDGGGHRPARPAVSSVSPAAEQALQEALGRLGEGRPLRTDGALTVSGLALEAGVSRSTANRASSVLAALQTLRSTAESMPTTAKPASDERTARNEMELLRRAHGQRVAALEASIDTLAQHVQMLTLDNERLRRTVATYAGNVMPMKDAAP